MKLVRASRAKGPANRSEAWGCATANMALPGSGSLAAGKPIGYFQVALTAVGFLITLVAGGYCIEWMLGNWASINQDTGDPYEKLAAIWRHILLPLAGMGIFAISWLWAGITSIQILAAHPKNPVPPRIV